MRFLGFKFERLEKQCYWTRMQLTRIRSIVHLWFKEKREKDRVGKRETREDQTGRWTADKITPVGSGTSLAHTLISSSPFPPLPTLRPRRHGRRG